MQISVSDIQFIETLVRQSGMQPQCIMEELGLPTDLFETPLARVIEFADYIRLLQRITETTGDETCSASLRQLRVGTSQYLLDTLPTGINLRSAMQHLAKGYNVVHAGEFNRVIETKKRISYCVDDQGFPYANFILEHDRHSFIESIILSVHFLFCRLTGEELLPRILRILTPRTVSTERASFLRFWGAPIIYGADYHAIEYDGRVAELEIKNAKFKSITNIFELGFGQQFTSDDDRISPVSLTRRIEKALAFSAQSQPVMARHLGMSVATMRRRLKHENTSFRTIRSQVLNRRAQRLINRGDRIESIARTLGFSDARSFSRAFITWNDMTPTAFQRQQVP
ncbi:MAG: helix-turn-helix domain-containing protein [Gammaproteobacteria bacterium]|nr:helix-turn-helix domain-containing protein [Gammaproteobacteria bacterium]